MPQAIAATRIPNIVNAFSSADWDVLHIDRDMHFLTSDFPLALLEIKLKTHLARFVPLAPDIGIIVYTVRSGIKTDSPTQSHFEVSSQSQVANLNRCVVKSAENHVISKGYSKWLASVVKKYRMYQVGINAETNSLEYVLRSTMA